MFKNLAVFLVCAAAFVNVNATYKKTSIIKVLRDFSPAILPNPEVKNFGCIVVRRANGKGGPPYPAVSGSASGSDCARFEITGAGHTGEYRFKELSTGKLMSHSPGSDWIYFNADVGDTSSNSLFKYETYQFKNNGESHPTLRPVNSNKVIYAKYDKGDLNVDNRGFKMFVNF